VNSTITFINHATVLIQIDGVNILTDPTYSRSVGFIAPRLQKPGIPFDLLPPIDLILISHNDYDHLSIRTLRRLRRQHRSKVFVPIGDEKHVRKAGMTDIQEMHWWESCDASGVKVSCVPAKHKSHRMLFQRNKQLCCGYVVERNGVAVYFAGDTGYGEHFHEIGGKFKLNAALLPIGAYKPHEWFREIHLNPQTAMRAFLDLKADLLIPIHWGTFKISDEPVREPPELLLQEAERLGVADRLRILENGGSVKIVEDSTALEGRSDDKV
jgi:L-ascorbate metabolism protein UlaG (beta-lactamase superfamily)